MKRSWGLCSVSCPGSRDCRGNGFVPYKSSTKANSEESGGHWDWSNQKLPHVLFSGYSIISLWFALAGTEGTQGDGGFLGSPTTQSRLKTGLAQDLSRSFPWAMENALSLFREPESWEVSAWNYPVQHPQPSQGETPPLYAQLGIRVMVCHSSRALPASVSFG